MMSVRHFSVKTRQRKEEKRRQRQEQKQQKEQVVSTTTASGSSSQPRPLSTIQVTHTKTASSPETTTTTATATSSSVVTHIAPAPPGDEDNEDENEPPFVSQFNMPDRDAEKSLIDVQNQVALLYKQGQYPQGLELAKEALEKTQDHFAGGGKTTTAKTTIDQQPLAPPAQYHPAIASALVNVGLGYKQLGDFASARHHYQRAQRAYQETVGTDHASYANVLHNLGLLYQSQLHLDPTLKSQSDRIRVMEQAMEVLQQALEIRKVELPPDHPHVVATQSALGMTLTAHILHQHKKVRSNNTMMTDTTGDDDNHNSPTTTTTTAPSYVPVVPPHISEESWNAAEQQLVQAYETALRNPRGESSLKRSDKNHYLNLQKKQQLMKKKKTTSATTTTDDTPMMMVMQTSSAAGAAQNLAVFYKARSTTLDQTNPLYDTYCQKAQDLYQSVLQVRTALLPKGHPDLYITQYSLAELYEATGQEELAQELRQVIVDTYDPPTQSETTASEASSSKKGANNGKMKHKGDHKK